MTDTTHYTLTVAAVVAAALAITTAAPVVTATAGADALDSQEQPQVRVESAAVDAGGTTTVQLATDGSDVAGYQANVTFDPSVLQVESVAGTDSFGDPVVNVNNEAGWVFVTQSQVEGSDEPALASITFAAVGDDGERSSLGLVRGDTVLNDADSTTVEVSLAPGEVTVGDSDSVSANAASDDEDQNANSQNGVDADVSGPGGPLGGIGPVTVAGGVAALGGTAAAGAYLGQRLG